MIYRSSIIDYHAMFFCSIFLQFVFEFKHLNDTKKKHYIEYVITLLIVQSGRWNHIQKESKTVGDPFRLPAPALVAARPAAVAGPTTAAAAPATAAIAPATAAIAPSSAANLNDLDHLGLRGPTAAPATATGPGIRAPATAAAAADPWTWAPATAAAVATTADPGTRAPATAANDARRAAGNQCA